MPHLTSCLLAAGLLALASCGGGEDDDAGGGTEPSPSDIGAGDFAVVMQRCMAEKGFTVEIMDDGGISSDVPTEQISQRDAAMEACTSEHGFDQPPEPLTDAQLSELYDDLVEVKECLEEAGHEVDDPPSLQSFVDSQGAAWHPYDSLDPSSLAEFQDVERQCPQPA